MLLCQAATGSSSKRLESRARSSARRTPEDHVGEPPTESPDGFGLRIPGCHALLDVGTTEPDASPLGDGDAMQRRINLPVATSAESVAHGVRGPDRNGRRAVPSGESGLGTETRAPAVSPTILAAESTPHPGIASRPGARELDEAGDSRSSSFARSVNSLGAGDELLGDARPRCHQCQPGDSSACRASTADGAP